LTKRTQTNKPKATPTVAPTINSTAPTSPVESIKVESKARVATKSKQANSTAKKAPAKPRARSKKAAVKVDVPELSQQDKDARILRANVTITQVDPSVLTKHVVTDCGVEPKPSKYGQFKAWLVFKLYHYTSYFRGF